MIELTLAEIAGLVDGTLHDADPATVVTGSVEYDSRAVGPGGLFLALPGERVDGHDYAATAYARGAVAVLGTRPVDGPRIEVADGIAAITALAAAVARRLEATVIGVTGSSGKTSTKDLLAQLLPAAGPTVAPAGSMNNELGHPYTVLRADAETRFLVLEMGARGVGHIRHLAEIAPPQLGVVLNVGSAHLGEFGSREAIALAKGELVEALPTDGIAVLNADDQLVAAMASRTRARVVSFGEADVADVRATGVALDDLGRPRFTLQVGAESAAVALRLVGAHHVSNALAAAAVGLAVGLDLEAVAAGLSGAVAASRWRMETTERADGVLIINDAYNANPESMRAALKTLATVARARRATGGRSFAVLGPMAELGPTAPEEHDALGRLAVRLDISQVIAVGDAARPIQHGAALEGSWNGESLWVPDVEGAITLLRELLEPGDVVLVKASRAASLERVALAIAEDSQAAKHSPADNSIEGGSTE
ncbi:UDP-N-acetylmuramoyl-tripeptide--D-alanyl-D-alanine ligase [Jatrophihabitans sp.]|uniref:UDP-N-acetylmuramoyl-tripeptide--D-alanyl-D- alanine ligase n=1 Tax=Jatrophihabitans sp. TaxID=1932789 RepID=UPI0030C72E2D|nr:UDP-N-acetylmuramoyl-tripeptide--D-alanyl-D-alanine ligase [Jatrophihabitans sp.]